MIIKDNIEDESECIDNEDLGFNKTTSEYEDMFKASGIKILYRDAIKCEGLLDTLCIIAQ